MGTTAYARLAYGVVLEGMFTREQVDDAIGADSGEQNEDGVVSVGVGDCGGRAVVFGDSLASVSEYDGAEVVDPERLADFNHPAARVAIAKVLEKLGHKPVSPEWLLIAHLS